MGRRIRLGRDVDHDEPFQSIGMPGGKLHGDFAAQRMAQKRNAAQILRDAQLVDIRRQCAVIHCCAVRRAAVVAEIHREDATPIGEAVGHRSPILEGAE